MKTKPCTRCDGIGVVNGALCPRCHGFKTITTGGRIVGQLFVNAAAVRSVFMPGVRS